MPPNSEEVDEHHILGHSWYRTWCPHCVVGCGVGQRHVASEEKSGTLPMIKVDYGYHSGQNNYIAQLHCFSINDGHPFT